MATSLKQDKITGIIYKYPFVITAVIVLAVLITTGMQLNSDIAACVIMAAGYLLITGYGIFLKKSKKLSTIDIVYIAMAAALIAICSWIQIPASVPFTL